MNQEIAFYYPNPMWYNGDWIKNLILFFDGIGLLVPEYMTDRVGESDPAIFEGLRQHGLLRLIEPEAAVDKVATEKLATALTDIIASGMLDDLGEQASEFHALSMSRMGYWGRAGLARMIFEELRERGLAGETEDGVSIPMHPMVRSLILTLLAQILRPYGEDNGWELNPATDRPQLVKALSDLFTLPNSPSKGTIFTFDMLTVGVDLGPFPIDEVLDFRKENQRLYRTYSRDVRRFALELSELDLGERAEAFEQRQEELEEIAAELRKVSRQAWKKPASFAMSLAGVGWSVATGDPFGAVLGGGGSLLGLGSSKIDNGAYSYLFSAQRRYA